MFRTAQATLTWQFSDFPSHATILFSRQIATTARGIGIFINLFGVPFAVDVVPVFSSDKKVSFRAGLMT